MARTQLAVETIPHNSVLDDATFSAGDDSNNNYFLNSGKEILVMKSTNGSLPADVVSVTDSEGRTGDITLTPGAGEISFAGPFKPSVFNQRGASDIGRVHVDIADATNVTFAVVQFKD